MHTKRLLIVAALILAAILAVSVWAWTQVPAGERVPVHWGPDGQIDRYGGKFEAFLVTPIATLGVTLLLAIVPRFAGRPRNFERSAKAYNAVCIGVLLVMLVVHVDVVLSALGKGPSVPTIPLAALGALFVLIGSHMGTIRSNYVLGIRTPWTLASELSWEKTHRLGGRLFVAWGLLVIIAALVGPIAGIICILAPTLLILPAFLLYSRGVWKSDPERRAATWSYRKSLAADREREQ